MPRPVKLSTTKVATPMAVSSRRQTGTLPPTPCEPCTRTTAGTRSAVPRGSVSSPETTAAGTSRLRRAKSPALGVSVAKRMIPATPSWRSARGATPAHAVSARIVSAPSTRVTMAE
jgi:hypothetical protein